MTNCHPLLPATSRIALPAASTIEIEIEIEYELRFQSLFDPGRALTFPCDATGVVAMDRLSDRARGNYLYARALLGRDFATPLVIRGAARAVPASAAVRLPAGHAAESAACLLPA